ncbi:MAG: FAD-binding oxidoreductase [Gemmatimonadetes bacterium]|nr:FAD-binding oxidoreductase [Gemmatimonadota bacterium]
MSVPSAPAVWEDGSWHELPSLGTDLTVDACVIGLGGSGLACVHELLDMGVRVAGIDAGRVASGAAGRNGGFLLAGCYDFYHDAVTRHGRARALSIYQATLQQIDRIADETPAAVRRTGSIRLATSDDEREDCNAQLAAMIADGLPVEPYSGAEGDGLLIPSDAAFDPLMRARLLALHAIERGAHLFENSPALSIEDGAVITAGGRVRCGAVIVAVDGALQHVLPELAARVRTARLQMLATAPDPDVRIPRPVYARYGFEYWQQLTDGRVAVGGFRDLGGDAEWTAGTDVTEEIQAALERQLREVIGSHAPITRRWAASVGYTPDGLPILEQVRRGVWAAGGYSGTGNVLGALCGRAAARLALGDGASFAAILHGHPEAASAPSGGRGRGVARRTDG